MFFPSWMDAIASAVLSAARRWRPDPSGTSPFRVLIDLFLMALCAGVSVLILYFGVVYAASLGEATPLSPDGWALMSKLGAAVGIALLLPLGVRFSRLALASVLLMLNGLALGGGAVALTTGPSIVFVVCAGVAFATSTSWLLLIRLAQDQAKARMISIAGAPAPGAPQGGAGFATAVMVAVPYLVLAGLARLLAEPLSGLHGYALRGALQDVMWVTAALAVSAAIALVAFAPGEPSTRTSQALTKEDWLTPFEMLREGRTRVLATIFALLAIAVALPEIFSLRWLQEHYDVTAGDASLVFSVAVVAGVLVALFAGPAADARPRFTLAVGATLMVLTFVVGLVGLLAESAETQIASIYGAVILSEISSTSLGVALSALLVSRPDRFDDARLGIAQVGRYVAQAVSLVAAFAYFYAGWGGTLTVGLVTSLALAVVSTRSTSLRFDIAGPDIPLDGGLRGLTLLDDEGRLAGIFNVGLFGVALDRVDIGDQLLDLGPLQIVVVKRRGFGWLSRRRLNKLKARRFRRGIKLPVGALTVKITFRRVGFRTVASEGGVALMSFVGVTIDAYSLRPRVPQDKPLPWWLTLRGWTRGWRRPAGS